MPSAFSLLCQLWVCYQLQHYFTLLVVPFLVQSLISRCEILHVLRLCKLMSDHLALICRRTCRTSFVQFLLVIAWLGTLR